jgi:hypothetical protein
MTHEKAFALVTEICPEKLGDLWSSTDHECCDTAWAVADQYQEAVVKLILPSGRWNSFGGQENGYCVPTR